MQGTQIRGMITAASPVLLIWAAYEAKVSSCKASRVGGQTANVPFALRKPAAAHSAKIATRFTAEPNAKLAERIMFRLRPTKSNLTLNCVLASAVGNQCQMMADFVAIGAGGKVAACAGGTY